MNMAKRNRIESTHQPDNVLMYSQSVNTTASYFDAASLEYIGRGVVHISSGDMDFDCIYYGHTTIHIYTVDEQNHGGDFDTSCSGFDSASGGPCVGRLGSVRLSETCLSTMMPPLPAHYAAT